MSESWEMEIVIFNELKDNPSDSFWYFSEYSDHSCSHMMSVSSDQLYF